MNRVKTGIPKLDEILDGGLPEGSTTVISGGPGAGKTILAAQYLYSGAVEHGEKGVYVSFSESSGNLITYLETLGWTLISNPPQGSILALGPPGLWARPTPTKEPLT